ncbi:MAG: DinB family protein [Rhodothermales bacterium]
MKSYRFIALLFAALISLPAAVLAQDGQPVIGSLKGLHDITANNILKAAEMLDESIYAFKPTDDVRTAGSIFAHIANAQFMFCSAAAGEQSPNSENYEETAKTKPQIVAALKKGLGYCSSVYGKMTDAAGAEMRNFFGNDMAASGILAFNSAHNYEHYGNLVTYMRLKGITPPSSM